MSGANDDLGKLRQLTYELNEIERNLHIRDERYRSILECMQEGVVELDTCGIIVYANHGMERMMGVGKGKLEGCYFPEFLLDPRHLEIDFTDRLLCKFPNVECVLVSAKGKRVYVLCSTSPIVVDEKVLGIAVVLTDITDRLILEERYKIVFNQATEGIIVVDANTHAILDCNLAMMARLGYSHEELLGMKIEDIEALHDANTVAEVIQSIINHKVLRFSSKHRTKKGDEVDVTVSSRVLTYNGNSFLLSVCCY